MGSFYQNGIVANLHDFSYGTSSDGNYRKLENDLIKFSKVNPMELILPCLFSEITGKALPKIISEINQTKFLNHIVIGLDRAKRKEYIEALKFFENLKISHSILWNDGPRLMELDEELKNKGLSPNEFGKGRNVWFCIGMTLARGKAESIALHDCDILTYEKSLLAKLFYPVANPVFNFQFCKGYYPRVADGKMNGRVSRLLVFPLLVAMEKTIGRSEYLDFMKSFRYPLAGEFSFRKNLLPRLRIPSDWGLEIGVLSEMQRNHASNRICQVDLAQKYDHKHQELSENDDNFGLSRMSIDITKALIRKLATQGNIFTLETFRSIKATYYRAALDMIDIYRSDAQMNDLNFDSHIEEKTVELFALNIMKAGESFFENPMETPFIPTWNRVLSAIPDFLDRLKLSVELDNAEFKN